MTGTFPGVRRNSLNLRLSCRIMMVAVSVGILFGIGQIILDLRDERAQAETTIDGILKATLPLAASAAFELNENSAEDVIAAFLPYHAIVRAEIRSDNDDVLARMDRAVPGLIESDVARWLYGDLQHFSRTLAHDTFDRPVGTLVVEFSPAILAQGVTRRAAVTIVFGILRNILIATIFLFVFHAFLTQPLLAMVRDFQDLDLQNPGSRRFDLPANHEDDEFGQLVRSINTYLDEAALMESRFRQGQKMEALGKLTGGVAHDFNNLLAVMMGNAELLEDRVATDEKARHHVMELEKAITSASALTSRLLAFSRQQILQPAVVNVGKLLEGMKNIFIRTLGENVDVRILKTDDLFTAMVDASQFEHALLNLAINARDAMPKGGVLAIEVCNETLDETYTDSQIDVAPGEYVLLTVSDTGCGIPAELLEKVFEPFFTTKGVGKGSGLGLSMVFGFAKQSHGHVSIYSEEGRGTSVKLYLPRANRGSALQGSPAEEDAVLPGGTERILLVEDDENVRQPPVEMLREVGYEVVPCAHGPSAIERLSGGERFDLLFTDVVLPQDMSGLEVAEAARRLQPGIRVLFTTGYTEDFMLAHGGLDPEAEVLNKPYRKGDLLRKVREVLDSDRS